MSVGSCCGGPTAVPFRTVTHRLKIDHARALVPLATAPNGVREVQGLRKQSVSPPTFGNQQRFSPPDTYPAAVMDAPHTYRRSRTGISHSTPRLPFAWL